MNKARLCLAIRPLPARLQLRRRCDVQGRHVGQRRKSNRKRDHLILLDLGNKFAAGKLIRLNLYSITLELTFRAL